MKLKLAESMVESPCIRRCCLDDNDICLGCFRTMEEICQWSLASSGERKEVLERAKNRELEHRRRWPGTP